MHNSARRVLGNSISLGNTTQMVNVAYQLNVITLKLINNKLLSNLLQQQTLHLRHYIDMAACYSSIAFTKLVCFEDGVPRYWAARSSCEGFEYRYTYSDNILM